MLATELARLSIRRQEVDGCSYNCDTEQWMVGRSPFQQPAFAWSPLWAIAGVSLASTQLVARSWSARLLCLAPLAAFGLWYGRTELRRYRIEEQIAQRSAFYQRVNVLPLADGVGEAILQGEI